MRTNAISDKEFTIICFALRYALGRNSYAPALVCDYINGRIPIMTETQRRMVIREIDFYSKYQLFADKIAEGQGLMLRRALEAVIHAEGLEDGYKGSS